MRGMADFLVAAAIVVFVLGDAGFDLGPGADMTLAQGILLALSIAVFIYLGVALFKAEWF